MSPGRELSPDREETSWEEGGIPNFGQRMNSPTRPYPGPGKLPPRELPPRGRAMRAYDDDRAVHFGEDDEREVEIDIDIGADFEQGMLPPPPRVPALSTDPPRGL